MRTGHLSAPVHSRGSFQNTTAWDTVVDCDRNFGCLFSSPRSAFRILGFQRMDLLCTVGILSCMSGIYWVFACPLSGVDPNFIIFWRVMIILLPPMLLLGIAINLWELRHVKTGNRQSNSLRRQLFIIFFFIIVFTTYFLISNFFRSAVFTYTYIS